jgi:hypothetical protein
MKIRHSLLSTLFLLLACASIASAQDQGSISDAAAPPNMLLLVRQEIKFGKAAERRKLEIASARAYDQLKVPISWIDLESLTGPPEALFFDPLDSYDQLDQLFAMYGQLLASHPDLARTQEDIEALVSGEKTFIAVRRDDLGFRPQTIDLSRARFMRLLEVRVYPGHEADFVEAANILAQAYEKIDADTPWVVYQVNAGAPSPTFLVFLPLSALKQNDDLLNWRQDLRNAEGEEASQRLEQIAKEAFAGTETNLYVIRPEMSHVQKEFAEGDPEFWSSKQQAQTPPPAAQKPAPRKDAEAKPKP